MTPVIDCTFSGLILGDSMALRLFFVMCGLQNPEDVGLLAVIMQTVDYQLVDHSNVHGPAMLGTVAVLTDLQATEVKHYFVLGIGYPFITMSLQSYE